MTRSRSQFGGGALPRGGGDGEVCLDRAPRPLRAENLAIGSPQSAGLGVPGVTARGKTASSIRLSVLLTPRQAADFLGVPESTLAQWRSQRRGPPYIKLESRLVRYRVAELEAYLAGHAVETVDNGRA